jgi:nucleoside recognition membrane protein YjiH
MDKKKKMKHKFVGLGFFLLFLGLVMFILSINIIRQNPDPSSHIVWSLIGCVSSVSLFVGALILFITLLVFLADKVHPAKVRS